MAVRGEPRVLLVQHFQRPINDVVRASVAAGAQSFGDAIFLSGKKLQCHDLKVSLQGVVNSCIRNLEHRFRNAVEGWTGGAEGGTVERVSGGKGV
jgi:hypothetical protein